MKASSGQKRIIHGRNQSTTLNIYCDASWLSNIETRRGVNGLVIRIGTNVIEVRSKAQSCIAESTAESEIMAIAIASKEAILYRKLLHELNASQVQPTPIYTDSEAAINSLNRPLSSTRSRHMDLRKLGLANKIDENMVILIQTNQLADLFTKPLGPNLFQQFSQAILNSEDIISRLPTIEKGCRESNRFIRSSALISMRLPSAIIPREARNYLGLL